MSTVFYFVRTGLPGRQAHTVQVMQNAHALARAGCDVHLFAGRTEAIPAEALLDYYGLPPHERLHLHAVPFLLKQRGRPNSSRMLPLAFRAWRLRHRLPEDAVVFTRQTKIAALIQKSGASRRLPHVHEVHDLKDISRIGPPGTPDHWEYPVLAGCDALVSVPAPCAAILGERTGRPVLWLPNGVTPDPDPWTDYERREGILYVGSFFEYEGFPTLLDMIDRLPDTRLTVVGGNPAAAFAEAKARATELGVADRIHFTGFVPPGKVREYLHRARVVVAPLADIPHNRWSMCPMKLVQYMGSGAAMVAPRFPTTEPLLAHKEEALLVRPDDSAALAAAAGMLLREPQLARQLAEGAYSRAQEYAWDTRGVRLAEWLQQSERKRVP